MNDPEVNAENAARIAQAYGKTVEEYALWVIEGIVNTADRETHGEGCGCPTHTRDAVTDLAWARGFLNPFGVETDYVEPDALA